MLIRENLETTGKDKNNLNGHISSIQRAVMSILKFDVFPFSVSVCICRSEFFSGFGGHTKHKCFIICPLHGC